MDERSLSTASSFSGMTELPQADVKNCLSLALDSHASRIVELTSDIEEQLGLVSDREYRMSRLSVLRKSALDQCIFPMMEPEFTASVIEYNDLLVKKRAILHNIYTCCKDFCASMRSEVDLVCSGEEQPKEETAELSQYCAGNQGSGECSEGSPETEKRQKRNRLPSCALHILWDFLRTHKNNPYPTTQQKEQLAKETNLTITQIRNWFTNTRKRKLTQSPDSDEDYSVESDRDESSSSKHFEAGRPKRHLNRKRTSGNTCFLGKSGFRRPPLLEKRHQNNVTEKPNPTGPGQWIQYGTEGIYTLRNRRLLPKQRRITFSQDPQLHGIGFDSKRLNNSPPLFEFPGISKEFCLNNGFSLPCKKQNLVDMDPGGPVCAYRGDEM